MEMMVPGEEPEAALSNAAIANQPGGAVTTCSTRSRDLQASLNRRSFISGILLTAGMGMLIDSLMGATAVALARTRRKTKGAAGSRR